MKTAMKTGELVYIKELDRYGFVHAVTPDGKVKAVNILNHDTGKFDIIEVIDKIVEAVGLIKALLIIIKSFFNKKAL